MKQLVVFCHSHEAYFLPKKLAEKAKEADKLYDEGDIDAMKVIDEIRKKYKPIMVFHLFTGDIG